VPVVLENPPNDARRDFGNAGDHIKNFNLFNSIAMLEKYLNLLEELRLLGEQIPAMIAEMPDNPRITRVGDGNCFIMSSAHISKNMSAEHHDFKYQYREIIKYLQKPTPLHPIEKLQRILEKGRIPDHENRFFTLHEDVLNHIKKSGIEAGLLT